MTSGRISRAGANDLMELATESATAPAQVAAIMLLDRPVELAEVRRALADRVPAVPRLRQRLRSVPFGAGRPIWVDDEAFAIDRQVSGRECPFPGDETALLRVAANLLRIRLPRDRPLWSITVVNGLADGGSALVVVLHHVISDGVGGLAALALLVDGAGPVPLVPFPSPPPTVRALIAESTGWRWRAAHRWRSGLTLLRAAAGELRVSHVLQAPRCSLNQPIGPARQIAVVRADLGAVAAAGHRCGGTVNDVLLTVVGGALAATLRGRGESADSFVLSVPVSGRSEASATELGNQVGVMPVQVLGEGEPAERLAELVGTAGTRRHPVGRGASAVLLGPAFRGLGQLGLFRWFVDRQHLVTTFVTNVRGPATRMSFLGVTVTDIVPVGLITGNITVAFAALSYAGTLTITALADPEHCPDLPVVVAALRDQLNRIVA